MFQKFWKSRGLWLRVALCWLLGCTFPFFDEVNQYDLRFEIRGQQEANKQIVMVYFDQDDWSAYHIPNPNLLRALKEYAVMTDSYFWRASTWNLLLGKILAQNPQSVGVTLFFNPDLPRPDESLKSLSDPRVIWAGQLDNEGRPVLPLMSNSYGYNVALVDLREDEDRVLRRFSAPLAPIAHMGLKLSEQKKGSSLQELGAFLGESRLINFRGGKNIYPSINAIDILQNRVPPSFFKDKIVVVGSRSIPSHQLRTPLGTLTRADVIAQIVDNVVGQRWIERLPAYMSALYLLVILLLVVTTMISYPQAVAFGFLVWLALGTTAASIWIFDSFYFWIPAISPLLLSLVGYVVFMGYQLSVKENQTWRLRQEKDMLSELDQLRNNFVSLISHDLKTPIAKIQAICDRLLAGQVSEEVREGLGSLRRESAELHRYIQSILQISRLESSQSQVRREAMDLNEVVEKVIGQLRPLAADKHQA
ncbi:MAG TPA: CHASE2 domain-containing protein, partial [Bdellovibrionales bacterium]|nr:CHASE2 domain-containing protein [Bdellovibrionales bacterium]